MMTESFKPVKIEVELWCKTCGITRKGVKLDLTHVIQSPIICKFCKNNIGVLRVE